MSFPNFRDWQSGSRVFEQMAVYGFLEPVTMVGGRQPQSAVALEVTDRLFAGRFQSRRCSGERSSRVRTGRAIRGSR